MVGVEGDGSSGRTYVIPWDRSPTSHGFPDIDGVALMDVSIACLHSAKLS